MQRIAVPMIGGMISSTLLTLIVIPALYGIIKGWNLPRARGPRARRLQGPRPLQETTSLTN
jgi:Cu(I)/Ag(I) efflux system membrane protein CusA/SilA